MARYVERHYNFYATYIYVNLRALLWAIGFDKGRIKEIYAPFAQIWNNKPEHADSQYCMFVVVVIKYENVFSLF